MSLNADPSLRGAPVDLDVDCLVELVAEAESAPRHVDNPALSVALDQHVVIETGDDAVELMCAQCPAMCTVKSIGGNAIALVHNRNECIGKD